MISAPLRSGPILSSTPCSTAFTLATVPTGINTGVCTTPCGSVSDALRPPPSAVFSIPNVSAISSIVEAPLILPARIVVAHNPPQRSDYPCGKQTDVDYGSNPMSDSSPNPPDPTPNPLLAEPEFVTPIDGTALTPAPPKGRRAAAAFIFFTVALDMLALGMIAPVLP